jgi:hypothetical protein
MSPTEGRSPHPISICPSARVMMGWFPSAPTLLQRVHVLPIIATHRRCCSPQIPVSPGSPLAVPARQLRVAALVLRPRSPPSCVAPARRPRSPPPPIIADNAHRRSSPPRGGLPPQSPLSSCRSCPAHRNRDVSDMPWGRPQIGVAAVSQTLLSYNIIAILNILNILKLNSIIFYNIL